MNCPTENHWQAALWVLLFLKGTPNKGMTYFCPGNIPRSAICPTLIAFADANWAENAADRKSISGLVVQLHDVTYAAQRPIGNVIMYRSKKQSCVTLSSTESEYYALGEATAQIVWLRRLLSELGFQQQQPTTMYQDNQACIKLASSEMLSSRTRHIDVKYHFTRNAITHEYIRLEYVPTKSQRADLFTKNLGRDLFNNLCIEIGMTTMALHE
jgi:hypothetical protein